MATITSKIDSTKQFSNTAEYLKEIAQFIAKENLYGSYNRHRTVPTTGDSYRVINETLVVIPLGLLAKRGIGRAYLAKVSGLSLFGNYCKSSISDTEIEFRYYQSYESGLYA